MKTLISNRIIIMLMAIMVSLPAFSIQDEVEKTIEKSFDVNQDVLLKVDNKFGKIHCNVWDESRITIVAKVSVEHHNASKAAQILDNIHIDIEGSASMVSAKTQIANTSGKNKNMELNIDYTINMPRSASVNLTNSFGDIYLDKCEGPVTIKLSYGNLDSRILTHEQTSVTMSFSEGNIEKMLMGDLRLRYSELKIGQADKCNIDSQFSELKITKANNLLFTSKYDEIDISSINNCTIDASFTEMDITHLANSLDADMTYGGLDIDDTNANFEKLDLTLSFTNAELNINNNAAYRIDAKLSFGSMELPAQHAITVDKKGYTSKTYTGTVGQNKSPQSMVIIRGKNADIEL